MGSKAYAVQIEGIGAVFGAGGAALWAGGPLAINSTTIDGSTCLIHAGTLVQPPQFSATELDLLTGIVRSGATSFQLHARDLVTETFLAVARARRPDAVLAAAASPTSATMTFSAAVTLNAIYYLGEEAVFINSLVSGTTYNVNRGWAGTPAQGHAAGANGYLAPPFWVGRRVTIYLLTLSGVTVTATRVVWRGYLTEAPSATGSTSTITLKAEDALGTLRRARINRDPVPWITQDVAGLRAYDGTLGVQVFGQLRPDTEGGLIQTRVRKLSAWATDGLYAAHQIGQSVVVTRGGVTLTGFAALDSTRFVADEAQAPPYWELAVWSRALDAAINAATGAPGVTPTLACDYPYHPLTIAAALLFSGRDEVDEDPLIFDVLHPQLALGVGFLADYTAWQAMIERTSHVEVDLLVLGWEGRKEDAWEIVTRELLPAYGFALSDNGAGLLAPIEVGLVDIGAFAAAPQLAPLPGTWDWSTGPFSALDTIEVTVGQTPWREGRTIQVNGTGLREVSTGRATRILNPQSAELRWPTIAASSAEAIAATQVASALIWRYDGLPVVTAQLQSDTGLRLGQVVRLLKPDGLLTPILFDRSGARVDGLWNTAALAAQIVSLRYNVERDIYDVKLLLSNYVFGKAAKWRAPAARIKSRTGTATYLIEGTTSDFDEPDSDALRLTAGDELRLVTKNLAPKAVARTVLSVTPSGADYLVTLSADFAVVGAAGDWLLCARSEDYSNTAVVGGEPYPYVWMTTAATLTRPGATTTEPDEYS